MAIVIIIILGLAGAIAFIFFRKNNFMAPAPQSANTTNFVGRPSEENLPTEQKLAVDIARQEVNKRFPNGGAMGKPYGFYNIVQDDPSKPNVYRVIFDIAGITDQAVWVYVDVKTGTVVNFVQTKG